MILAIAKKEFRDAWRDGRFRWAALVVVGLMLVSLVLAWQQLERNRAERDAATAIERENWLGQGDKNPHAASHYGAYVFKPSSPLALIDRGIEPYVGTTFYLEAHAQNHSTHLPAQDATSLRRFGDLTPATGLQLLAPLLVILLAFGALAGERERGTLRQVLALGVRPRQLVLGKALGLGAVLAVLLLPVAAGALIALRLLPGGDDGWLPRLGLMGAASALYLAAVLALALLVSALAPTSRAALAILLVGWAANCVLAPRLVTDLVPRFVPTPLLAEFETELRKDLRDGLDGHDPRNERLQALMRDTLKKHNARSVAELPFNFNGLAMLESERMSHEVLDHHFGRLWDRLARQDRAVTWAGLGAPLLAFRSASMALAGTDLTHHRHFSTAAEQHRRTFVRLLNEDMMNNSRYGDHSYTVGRAHWEKLPPFDYRPPGLAEAWRAAAPGFVILALWALFAWLALIFAGRRLRAA